MEEYLQGYQEFLTSKKKTSENTVLSYLRDVKAFIAFMKANGVTAPNKVNTTNVMAFILELERQKKATSTISRNIVSLRSFFRYLWDSGVVTGNPADPIESPKVEKRLPDILSLQEVEMLFEQPDLSLKKGIRDKSMLEILYASGIRASEIVSLKMSDVNLTLGYIKCFSSTRNRIVPIGAKAVTATNDYIAKARGQMVKDENETVLFVNCNGLPMTRQGFWKILKQYSKKASINKDITPNILRHSFAAHLVANGADLQSVQEMMGYSDISAAQVYVQVHKNKLNEVYKMAHPRA